MIRIVSQAETMAEWNNRALLDLRVAGSSSAEQLSIFPQKVNSHNGFQFLQELVCRHSSLVPRPCIKAAIILVS